MQLFHQIPKGLALFLIAASGLLAVACGGDSADNTARVSSAPVLDGADNASSATPSSPFGAGEVSDSPPAVANSSGEDAGPGTNEDTSTTEPGESPDTANPTEPGDTPVSEAPLKPECVPEEGKTITELEDVMIPAVDIPAESIPEMELDGVIIPGVEIPAIHIDAQIIDTGCIAEYEAPGACFGRVEISSVEMGPIEIPGAELPGFEFEGEMIDADVAEGDAAEGDRTAEEVQAQVCRQDSNEDDNFIPSVFRPSLFRPSLFRASLFRPSMFRPRFCSDSGECIPAARIPSARVDSVRVGSVRVDSERLDSQRLPDAPEVNVFDDDDTMTLSAPADVLFDFDQAILRPDATTALEAIAAALDDAGATADVLVEGHTDSKGDDAYNDDLSERRAQAVTDWLVSNTDIDPGAISTRGLGENFPVAANETDAGADNPEGRQQNRRVVITGKST